MQAKPHITLIVTDYAAFAELARELGYATEDTPIVAWATPEDVRGQHVLTLGDLPLSLSVYAESVTELPLHLTPEDRANMQCGTLTLERLREVAGDPDTYSVRPSRAVALIREPHGTFTRDEWITAGDRTYSSRWNVKPHDLPYSATRIDYDTADLSTYRDGGSWLLSGRALIDPVAWAEGELVEGRKTWRMIAAERRAEGREKLAEQCDALALTEDRPDPITVRVVVLASVLDGGEQQEPLLLAERGGETVYYRGRWRGMHSVDQQTLARVSVILDWVPTPRPDIALLGTAEELLSQCTQD